MGLPHIIVMASNVALAILIPSRTGINISFPVPYLASGRQRIQLHYSKSMRHSKDRKPVRLKLAKSRFLVCNYLEWEGAKPRLNLILGWIIRISADAAQAIP